MKTTIDLDRMSAASTWPPLARPRQPARRATVRLGVLLSVSATLVAVVLRAVLDVPTVAILAVVVVVGFVLSWRAAGQPIDRRDA